jgi:hypothetical protein
MRRGFLTARRWRDGLVHLSMHPDLLMDPDCTVFISAWITHAGRHGTSQRLREHLTTLSRRRVEHEIGLQHEFLARMPTVGDGLDLVTRAQAVHRQWFADLDLPAIRWSRQPPRRRLRHLRFGCYRRQDAVVELSPRLARPWIASSFFDHVLFHEFCHHRQARERTPRREGVHSTRFRTWERAYPEHDDAMLWERLALPWLLDDGSPPWYSQARSHP